PAVERRLPAVPAGGVLPAIEHSASASAARAAVGSAGRASFARLPVGDAGAVPAGAVALDSVDVRPRADVLAGSIVASEPPHRSAERPLCPRDTPVASADDKLDAYHRGKGSHDGSDEAEDRRRTDGGREGGATHHRAGSARRRRTPGRLRERRRGEGTSRRARSSRESGLSHDRTQEGDGVIHRPSLVSGRYSEMRESCSSPSPVVDRAASTAGDSCVSCTSDRNAEVTASRCTGSAVLPPAST